MNEQNAQFGRDIVNELVADVYATSHAAGQPLTPRQSCFLAALKVCEQAPDALFAAVGKTEQAAQDIIVGRVEPTLNDIAAATTHIGAKINLTDYIY